MEKVEGIQREHTMMRIDEEEEDEDEGDKKLTIEASDREGLIRQVKYDKIIK